MSGLSLVCLWVGMSETDLLLRLGRYLAGGRYADCKAGNGGMVLLFMNADGESTVLLVC